MGHLPTQCVTSKDKHRNCNWPTFKPKSTITHKVSVSMFALVCMKNAEQLNNSHQENKCNAFWFSEMVRFISICLEMCIQQSAMSFTCVFSITEAWLNVSHGAFSAPHPMLISCGGLLWDSEREGHHQRDREQRHALTVSPLKHASAESDTYM